MGLFDRFFQKKALSMGNFMPRWIIGKPIWKEWDYSNAVNEGFKKNNLVYSCIDKIAKSASSVDWYVYKKKADGTYEKIDNHPLEALINRPNPFMSKRDFITRWTYSMFLGGNSIMFKVRSIESQPPTELWYLPQDTLSPVPHKTKFIEKYVYDYDGVKQDIATRDIIHDRFIDPSNIYWGISPIKSASMLIDSDNQAVEWNKFSMSQRAISDGAFIIDQPLTKDQWEDVTEQIESNHTGSQNARKFWVLGAGAKWQQMSLSPVEMDFIQSKKLNREDIASIFGVPPAMLGFYENATLANIETARKVFWQDTVVPYLDGIRDALNSSLTIEYGDVYLDYDLSTVEALQTNIADKISNAISLFTMGVPFNDINTLLDIGLDNIEGGDVGYLAANLIPIERVLEPPQPPPQLAPPKDGPPNTDDGQGTQSDTTGKPPQDDNTQKNTNTPLSFKNFLEDNLSTIPKSELYQLDLKERQRSPHDTRFTHKLTQLFEKMGREVSKNPSQYEKAIDKFEEEWNNLFVNSWKAIIQDVGVTEYNAILKQVKSFVPYDESKLNILQALFDNTMLDWIKRTCAEKVTNISKFTKSQIAKTIGDIEEAFQKEGKRAPIDDIAKGIKAKFKDFSRYRSFMIARTEVASATETASYQASHIVQQNVDPTEKQIVIKRSWLSALDERTRETHIEAHGQVRGLDEKFNVGKAELKYPGEYEANHGEETINCRCTTITVVERKK
jgi:HK97 family phage portal protein